MKHLILSVSSSSYSVKRLIEEIESRGDTYEVINPADLYAFISSTQSGHDHIYLRGKDKSERILSKSFDSVIPRIAGTGFEHGSMIVRQLSNNMGIFSTGSERGLKICSNKMLTAQVLSRAKIRNPKQVLAHQPGDFKELIDLVGGLPCVAKLQRGSLGVGIMVMNDVLAASTSLRSFQSLGVDVILQQFIETGTPANDIRVFVIGAETKNPKVFAYKRYALDSDFRSNYSISGQGEKVKITEEEKQMAIDSALAVGLGVCGVDILRQHSDNKAFICEINGSPGLKGLETITGENVAGAIIDYVRENYKKKNSQSAKTNANSSHNSTIPTSIDDLPHNQEWDKNNIKSNNVDWESINKLPHNIDFDQTNGKDNSNRVDRDKINKLAHNRKSGKVKGKSKSGKVEWGVINKLLHNIGVK